MRNPSGSFYSHPRTPLTSGTVSPPEQRPHEASPAGQAAAEAVLQRHWGHDRFRAGQWDAIEAVLAEQDVLAILPTGGGKSVCYQVPALLREGLTLVVSPLIALMQDQVAGLKARGIQADFINSTLSAREIDQRWTDAEFGRYRLLYVAPERLQTDVFLARAGRLNIRLLAVDEAHCISEWGHHFRPSYLQIAEARAQFGDPPTLAVTATATPEVRRDIVRHLALRGPRVIVKGFDRPNLVWSIFRTENKSAKVLDVVKGVEGSGVVYAATRRGTEEWAARLEKQGETAAAYHGGLKSDVRAERQAAWLRGETRIMVATNAFGMGIDKPDVRFVVHADVPGTLEAYYQEAGRGGRDGARAYAVLLFQPGDEATQRSLIEEGYPDAQTVRKVYDAACSLAQIPIGTLPEAPVAVDVEKVARVSGERLGKTKQAIELLERQGTWQPLLGHRHRAYLWFETSAEAMRHYADGQQAALSDFVDALLRAVHADAFSGWWDIDVRMLQRRTGLTRERLYKGMAFLEERGLLRWQPPGTTALVQLAEPRTSRLPVDDRMVRRAKRQAEARLEHMLRYARSVTCRRHFLLAYFGEGSPERCGQCDVCLGRHQAVVITPQDEPTMRHVLQQIAEAVPRSEWFVGEAPPPQRVDGLLAWLLQEGYVYLPDPLGETFQLTPKAEAFMKQWTPRR